MLAWLGRGLNRLPASREKRNLLLYAALVAILIIVHFIVAAYPAAAANAMQAALFSWKGIGIIGSLGFMGVLALNQTRCRSPASSQSPTRDSR